MWSERSEETRSGGRQDVMLQVWGGRTQEVGVFKRKRYEERRGKSTSTPGVWSKVREHSGAKGLPPRGAVMSMVGWTMRREVVTFVECRVQL